MKSTPSPTPTRRPARPGSASGLKLALTAAALTATIGGGAAFAAADLPTVADAAPPAMAAAPVADTITLDLPPIPTLVPLPAARPGQSRPPAQAVAPLPTVAVPVAAPAALPALRVVRQPPAVRQPAPVVRTRSSR
jgi:hypothetical protein